MPARSTSFPHAILMILGVAAAYFVGGRLGLALAIPPGYATAVWPATGVALAATLMIGRYAAIGVFLGSLLINISADGAALDATKVGIALAIGAGAALHALIGRGLLRSRIGYPTALLHGSEVVKFLVLAGPVSCLVSASIGTSVLSISGSITPDAAPFTAWTWWVGDSIGAMVFLPLLLIFFGEPREVWRRRRINVALPLVGAFGLCVLAFVFASRAENQEIQRAFDVKASELQNRIELELHADRELVFSIRSLFDSSQQVDRDEFGLFVAHALETHTGLQAIEWVPRVPHEERVAFEERARGDGLSDFGFRERDGEDRIVPAADRDEYFPVYYVEPLVGNEAALGFDLAALPARRKAIERARDSGLPVATARIQLIQESGTSSGILVFLPIYSRDSAVESIESRRQNLAGFALGVFRIDDMVARGVAGFDGGNVELSLVDLDAPPELAQLFGTSESSPSGRSNIAPLVVVLEFGGRNWELRIEPTDQYLASTRTWSTWAVLAGGLLISAILGAFLLSLTGYSVLVEQEVARRTGELVRSNEDLSQFAYVASHDLQEPLRTVSSFATLLAKRYRGKLDENADEFIGLITEGTARMQALINDLLSYSRVGTKNKPFEDVRLDEVLDSALANLRAAVEEADPAITRDPLPEVWGDRAQLTQLLQNLLANALKFRRDPKLEIHVGVRQVDGEWQLSVRDNGVGFDPAFADRIFVIFQRLHGKREYSGTGIGLAICKKVAELHGGRIWVQSQPGRGTTFFFTMPTDPGKRGGLHA